MGHARSSVSRSNECLRGVPNEASGPYFARYSQESIAQLRTVDLIPALPPPPHQCRERLHRAAVEARSALTARGLPANPAAIAQRAADTIQVPLVNHARTHMCFGGPSYSIIQLSCVNVTRYTHPPAHTHMVLAHTGPFYHSVSVSVCCVSAVCIRLSAPVLFGHSQSPCLRRLFLDRLSMSMSASIWICLRVRSRLGPRPPAIRGQTHPPQRLSRPLLWSSQWVRFGYVRGTFDLACFIAIRSPSCLVIILDSIHTDSPSPKSVCLSDIVSRVFIFHFSSYHTGEY